MEYSLVILAVILILAAKDVFQKRHTIVHNFPLVGWSRYILEKMGAPLRQYWFANNSEERPFNRSERSWVYASSKLENNFSGFGSDKDFQHLDHIFIKNALLASPSKKYKFDSLPCRKIMGKNRAKPYFPKSIVNISGMSYGALSAAAVTALNKGALMAHCYQNTGEGGLSPFHKNGGDIIFQLGTGYFGARYWDGEFNLPQLVDLCKKNPFIKAIEIKLSQGAKPGKGGVLPGAKVTKEISEIRGVPLGKDVISPGYHTAFSNIDEMLDFIETIADATGLPVGIKSAVGQLDDWSILAYKMKATGKGPDFITIDGGEGGTGAAPISFADHVSLPFKEAFTSVYKIFKKAGIEEQVVWIASGKLGLPAKAIMAFSMGADMINVGREALLALGCIQSQLCHTNNCPTGITTNSLWRQKGLDPTIKSLRVLNYLNALKKEILEITHACGFDHPTRIPMSDVALNCGNNTINSLFEIYHYEK